MNCAAGMDDTPAAMAKHKKGLKDLQTLQRQAELLNA